MSDFYSIFDSTNQYQVALLSVYPTNLRIIQASLEKTKSREFSLVAQFEL